MFVVFLLVTVVGFSVLVAVLVTKSLKEREAAKTLVFDRLLAALRKGGLTGDLLERAAQEAGLSKNETRDVAVRLYIKCFRYSFDNSTVASDLPLIAAKLSITDAERESVENPLRIERYRQVWEKIEPGGLPELSNLLVMGKHKQKLGITSQMARVAFRSDCSDIYRTAYRTWLSEPEKLSTEYLKHLCVVFGFDSLGTAHLVKPDAIDHMRSRIESHIAYGNTTVSDRNALLQRMHELNIDASDVCDSWLRFERLISLQQYRDGDLPKEPVRIALRPGEICHFKNSCQFAFKSPRGEWKTIKGDLFLSNQRLILASTEAGKSFEMKLSNIVDFEHSPQGIQIRSTASRGSGAYVVSDSEMLDAMLAGVLRNDVSPAVRSRTIPSFVKQQVWARDKAQCVICGSMDDLHYDHDIPYSRGGGNTVENIRLLCARCNLQKRDRIE
jgi:hypothetical protein